MRISHSSRRLAWLAIMFIAGVTCVPRHDNGTVATTTVDSTRSGSRTARAVDSSRSGVTSTPVDGAVSTQHVDSAALEPARSDTALRIVISLATRRLWVVRGDDTLRAAPVAVGMNARLEYEGRTWWFRTPRGERTVLAKRASPVWVPPEWHYVEVAREYGFRLATLPRDSAVALPDGRLLEVRDGVAGVVGADSIFAPLPTDEEIVFDSTLYIPPLGSKNRQITGELGAYQLDLGDGYLLHGTPHTASIGTATTHGCIRLHDDDIAWLYDNVAVGTKVDIY